jgi:CDP-6-deoxy-D-xylo-4-hexulose-3-dehydrase
LVTGVGGLALTNDDELAVKLRSLMNHGRDSIYLSIDDDKNKQGKELELIMKNRFKFVSMGYSYRATEMEAALGLGQIEQRNEFERKRKLNAEYLTRGLSKWGSYLQLPEAMPGSDHIFMMYPIVVITEKFTRDELTSFLESKNIETRYMLPLINQPFYLKMFGNLEPRYPVAAKINQCGFYIGCHRSMAMSELDYIIRTFDEFFSTIV